MNKITEHYHKMKRDAEREHSFAKQYFVWNEVERTMENTIEIIQRKIAESRKRPIEVERDMATIEDYRTVLRVAKDFAGAAKEVLK